MSSVIVKPKIISFLLLFVCLCQYQFTKSYAQYIGTPVIYSCTPQFIQQGQVTTSVVTGENLHSTAIGVRGGDVFALILKQDPEGKSLTVQFAVQPTAIPGEREFFLRNEEGKEAHFPITVIPTGSPTVENIYPNSGIPGSTILLYITGMGLTNPVVTTTSDQFLVNSYRSSKDGTILYLSVSLTPNITSGTYQIFINTIGGQAQADFIASTKTNIDEGSLSVDPYSPGLYSIEVNSNDKTQLVLKGAMFDANPQNNIVTLILNENGTAVGKEVNIVSANNNEIVVSLPPDISIMQTISFAVSNADGKSSNIKSVDLESLQNNNKENTQSNNSQTSINISTSTIATADPQNTQKPAAEAVTTAVLATNEASTGQELNKQNNKPETLPALVNDDPKIAQNIQKISQYIFSSTTNNETTKELGTGSIDINKIKDPAQLINSIEETKQIKSQAELIMIALNEAKHSQEFSETIKKAESLKNKVDELERLLVLEKQKNTPNPRKLAKYQQLLKSTNAESRSQTFVLLNNLLKYKPQLKNLLTQKPFDLAAIQPNIPDDTVILQYVPTEEGIIIFIVDKENLKTRINKNISKNILNREIQAYRQLFENQIEKIKQTGRAIPITSWKDDKSAAYKKEILPLKEHTVFLYNSLISPVEKEIAGKKNIAIIANGWLRYLPFQSLAKPAKDGNLKFLISDKSIVYLDSVIALSKAETVPLSTMASVIVFANPDGTLNSANKEAEIITMLYSKTTKSLIQKPFNIPLINQFAKKADILHLATHGYLDSADIDSSYLISGKKLVGKNYVAEKMYLKDIYDLRLDNSKLVVLSGCDTGKLGNLSGEPDDIVGSLATAFRVAGADTILASLWKAHDEATKIIMQSFYENIKSGLGKAEALRLAELKVKSNPKYGHPLFWALFSLIGDWR